MSRLLESIKNSCNVDTSDEAGYLSIYFPLRSKRLAIAVYGTGHPTDRPAISEYSIDGGPSYQLRFQPPEKVYQYLFYQSKPLSQEEHTLLIMNGADMFFSIDYLVVTPHESVTTTVTTKNLVTVTASTAKLQRSPNLALIIGTTVGGTVLLVLLLVVVFLVKKGRQPNYRVDPFPPLEQVPHWSGRLAEALIVASEARSSTQLSAKSNRPRDVPSSSVRGARSTQSLQQPQPMNQPRAGPSSISQSTSFPPLYSTRTHLYEEVLPEYH
ncbi:hypothetical protein AMATHDRAFT_4264 [Amanita thiersii Skay4041]|uniref:Uncharacterized protein n=1 Tax=Amanita thiersii Skay4041 TaxID=703135 RepID=A0A2A9NQZ6_9AGAR|nr:hypothetical protein AMATHDRAFT_4264 [Amanita thiersii Skay4041]